MKNKYIAITLLASMILTTGCDQFLDLEPLDAQTEVIYFKSKSDFVAASMKLHDDIYAWKTTDTDANTTYDINFDRGTDTGGGSTGLNTTAASDGYYKNAYKWLRRCNTVIEKGEVYSNKDEISGSIGQAYFFRAWHHFFLLKRYGGVTIANRVPDTNSDIVVGPRASRYEVVKQIIDDLDVAIANLKSTTAASTNNDGQVTLEAAKSFKARICLFEGTWDKYVGAITDGDGAKEGAGSNKPSGYPSVQEFLTMAKNISSEIIDSKTFELWKGVEAVSNTGNNDMYEHSSYYYLFNLEGAASNPAGKDKSSNKESIFRTVYDATNRASGMNLTHTWPAGMTRKLADMYLCTDGLPVHLSPLFDGFTDFNAEYKNRDYRFRAVQNMCKEWDQFAWAWGYGYYATGADYSQDITKKDMANYMSIPNFRTLTGGGIGSRKFRTELSTVKSLEASAQDYMHIRMAEIYLIYAEATCELGNGSISDADLDKSLNVVRARGGVAPLNVALLTKANQLASEKGYGQLTMLGEIRRERACELYAEGHRLTDLYRWASAEKALAGQPTCGVYLSYKGEDSYVKTLINPLDKLPVYNPTAFPASMINQERINFEEYAGLTPMEPGCVIGDQIANRKFAQKNYLLPIPTDEIKLNSKLLQNPGW